MGVVYYYSPPKAINSITLEDEVRAAGLPVIHYGCTADADSVNIAMERALTAPEKTTLDNVYANHVPPPPPQGGTGHGVNLIMTGPQSIPYATNTPVLFGSSPQDTDDYWTLSSQTRVTIPASRPGPYLMTGFMRWTAESTGIRGLFAYYNGSPMGPIHIIDTNNSDATGSSTFAMAAQLNSGDYVEMGVVHTRGAGTALNLVDGRFSVWEL
jgi:hypothetical protein